jgi:AmiR/NasT family two-component response regulator
VPARHPLTAEVHQATGMVLAQLDVGAREAYLRLRAHAFAEGLPLSEVAHAVLTRTLRFSPEVDHPRTEGP